MECKYFANYLPFLYPANLKCMPAITFKLHYSSLVTWVLYLYMVSPKKLGFGLRFDDIVLDLF